MDAYATEAQLETWLPSDAVVDDADRQLLRASELIDDTVRAPYTVGDDGIPTDSDIAQALADATCAQVEFWLEVGESHDVDGGAGTQVSVPGYSGTRARELAPRARRILLVNGLLSSSIIPTTADRFFQVTS